MCEASLVEVSGAGEALELLWPITKGKGEIRGCDADATPRRVLM